MTDPASFSSDLPPDLKGRAQPFPLRWADVPSDGVKPRSWVGRADFIGVTVVLPEIDAPTLSIFWPSHGRLPICYGPEASFPERETHAGFVTQVLAREGNAIRVQGYFTEPARIRALADDATPGCVFRLEPVISRVPGYKDQLEGFTLRCL
jgi:hypothetical protein